MKINKCANELGKYTFISTLPANVMLVQTGKHKVCLFELKILQKIILLQYLQYLF